MHALCVMGTSSASATATNFPGLTYTTLSQPFGDGLKMWDDNSRVSSGVVGGGPELCEGGTYLRPSKHVVSDFK